MSLFSELKRRNVFKVVIAYLMLSWLILQLVDVVSPLLLLPDWIARAFLLLLVVLFPVMIMFTWAFELTPQGIKKTDAIDEEASTLKQTGQQINYTIIAALVVIIGIQYWMGGEAEVEARENTIAVMPFADMSPDGSQEYFGDGIAEEILNTLVGFEELDVTSRTSSFALKGQQLLIPDIAARLNVNYIVEGSIRSDGDQVRVTAQLIDVANDTHLWSDTFDRELTSIFAIQDEISRSITNALKLELIGGEVLVEVPTENMDAYTLYLQGHALLLQRSYGNFNLVEQSIEIFKQALEFDPDFSKAWADLASGYAVLWLYAPSNYYTVEDVVLIKELSLEAVNRAITLDPENPTAWAAKGAVHNYYEVDFKAAHTAFNHALKLDPDSVEALGRLGILYYSAGLYEDSEQHLRRALEMAPDQPALNVSLAHAISMKGDYEEAVIYAKKGIEGGAVAGYETLVPYALSKNDKEAAVLLLGDYYEMYGGLAGPYIENYVEAYFGPDLRDKVKSYPEYGNFRIVLTMLHDSQGIYDAIMTPGNRSSIRMMFHPIFRDMLNQAPIKKLIRENVMLSYWKFNKFPSFCRPVGDDDYECQDGKGNWPD